MPIPLQAVRTFETTAIHVRITLTTGTCSCNVWATSHRSAAVVAGRNEQIVNVLKRTAIDTLQETHTQWRATFV